NGDGASWIDAGLEVAGGRGHRQLDRFHVYRDIRRAYPDEEAAKFIAHLRAGRVDVVLDTWKRAYPGKACRPRRVHGAKRCGSFFHSGESSCGIIETHRETSCQPTRLSTALAPWKRA